MRYTTGMGALALLCVAWRAHARAQPFARRGQNALESWLYASNVLLVASALPLCVAARRRSALRVAARRRSTTRRLMSAVRRGVVLLRLHRARNCGVRVDLRLLRR